MRDGRRWRRVLPRVRHALPYAVVRDPRVRHGAPAAVRGRAGRGRAAAGGRALVGHAVHNDLKVLMLGHRRRMTRDTQYHAGKARMLGTNRPALRNLVKAQVVVSIQEGEHSSVSAPLIPVWRSSLMLTFANVATGYRHTRDDGSVQTTSQGVGQGRSLLPTIFIHLTFAVQETSTL